MDALWFLNILFRGFGLLEIDKFQGVGYTLYRNI